jgi:hypothetical protein
MSATSFLWELIQKDNDSQEQQEVAEEENHLDDIYYELEKFTDEYSEDFRDDHY